jgi:hypothetical protein
MATRKSRDESALLACCDSEQEFKAIQREARRLEPRLRKTLLPKVLRLIKKKKQKQN